MLSPFLVAGMRAGVSLSQRPAWSCLGHFSHLAPPTLHPRPASERRIPFPESPLAAGGKAHHLTTGPLFRSPEVLCGSPLQCQARRSVSNLCMRNWRRLYNDFQPGAFCPQVLGTYLTNTREWMLLPSTGWRPGVLLNP